MSADKKLDKIVEEAEAASSVTKNEENGSLEYKFSGGLVFEDMTLEKTDGADPKEAKEAKKTEEPEVIPELSLDEFAIPDSFEIDEKYNTPATPDTPTTIFRTYIPTFSKVSETYRMNNDPRPRPQLEPEADKEEPNEQTEALDPTAELDETHDDAVEVSISGNESDDGETLNIFKFRDKSTETGSAPQIPLASEVVIPETEKAPEREEELIHEPEAEPEAEPIPEIKSEEPKSYTIPDPTDAIHVVDYSNSGKEAPKYVPAAPEGVSEEPPKNKKRRLTESEFETQASRDEFKDAFLDSLLSIKIRAGAMAIIALFLLIFENFLADSDFVRLMGIWAPAAIDGIFATALFVLALPETLRAFKYLFTGRIIPEIYLTASFAAELAYTLVMLASGRPNCPLYGFLFGVFAITTVLSSYFRTSADFTAFKVVSRNCEKQILDKKLTRSLGEENMALDGAIDSYKSRTARIFRVSFISDFFKRVSKVSENSLSAVISMSIAFGASLVTGIVSYFVADGITSAASSFTLVFLLAIPAFSVLIRKLPYFDAQNAALAENSTLVGETSYGDFSSVDVIAFDDTDIFGLEDVNLRRLMLYSDKASVETALAQISSLFASVGGPLGNLFKNSLDRRYHFHAASGVTIESDGVSGIVDGKKIEAGTEEYMLRHNIIIPDITAKREVGSDTTKIMYAAENGEVYAKFYIRYSFSEEFTMLLPAIKAEGIVPLIYTRDPNISNDLLKTLSAGSDFMRVMKKYSPLSEADNRIYPRVSAGLVTYGDKINAINMILLTKKYKKFGERLSGTELYASIIGAGLAAVLALAGMTAVPAVIFSLWQIAWCAVLRFASKNSFIPSSTDVESK